MTFLGTLPGDTNSYAAAVNEVGVVAGVSMDGAGGSHAFLVVPEDTDGDGLPDTWYRDTNGDGFNDLMIALDDLIDPSIGWNLRKVYSSGINNRGQIVGEGYNAIGEVRAYRFTPGVAGAWAEVDDLGTLPNCTERWGRSINDQADVAGYCRRTDGTSRAFVYTDWAGNGTEEMRDIGDLGGGGAAAMGINNSGWVTGISAIKTGGPAHAFRYKPGIGMQDLGALKGGGNSWGGGINDAGRVVGQSDSTATPYHGVAPWHAFLYTDEAGMKDLGTLGGYLSSAVGINSKDEVVGNATQSTQGGLFGGAPYHGFLYTNKTNTGAPAMFKVESLIPILPPGYQGPTYAEGINDFGQICGEADGEAILLTPLP
jgi:probable HAF family extracellular repeat protein